MSNPERWVTLDLALKVPSLITKVFWLWSVVDRVANPLGDEPTQARLRPVGVVVGPPSFDDPPGHEQAHQAADGDG